mgnify:CR=1 FL=1
MYFLVGSSLPSLKLLWFVCLIIFTVDIHTREVEVYLGEEVIAARKAWSVSDSVSSTVEIDQVREMKQYLTKLDNKFQKAGGYDLLGKAAFIRWAWLSSKDKSWIMQIPFLPKARKNILDSLLKANWQKKADGVFENRTLLISVKDSKVLLGSNLDLDKLVKESSYWSIPACDWFQIRAFKPLFDELALRQPRLDALLSYVNEIHLSWVKGDLVADFQLTDSERATTLVISANTGLQFVKNLIIAEDSYKLEGWQLLDFISFSQQSVNSKAIEFMFERLMFQSYGKVFQVKYVGVGDFGKFLTNALPKKIFRLLLALLPQYSQHRDQLSKLVRTGGAKRSRFSRENRVVKDSCESQMKMIKQAVEFYNLDHLKQGKYELIKSKLFEEGYLPEDLSCEGKLIKNEKMFTQEVNGSIVRHK